jgi:hypothetical protein
MRDDLALQIASDRAALHGFEIPSGHDANIFTCAKQDRLQFMSLLEVLNDERREIAIEYVILKKTEKQIATMHGKKSQSMMGREINSIVRILGAALLLGRHPSVEIMRSTLAGEQMDVRIAEMIASYQVRRDFDKTAEQFRVKAPQLRKAFRRAQKFLERSDHMRSKALAEHLKNLLTQNSESSLARLKKIHRQIFTDPEIVGQFTIDMEKPGTLALFTPRAGQVSNASQI